MGVRPFNIMSLGKAGLLDPSQMGYNDSLEVIKDESMKIQKSFVKIGWYLKHIRDNKLYKEAGYANIYECAVDQLGYSQSSVSRFINICEKFSKDHDSPELDEKYAGFDKSQMIEMLPMESEQLERVTPDMTVSEIRAVKRVAEEDTDDNLSGQTSIEKDFPEYLPEADCSLISGFEKDEYAMSHRKDDITVQSEELMKSNDDVIIDGTYREIEEEKSAYGYSISEGQVRTKLPSPENSEQRKEWLNSYQEWGLWYHDENIDVNYYKLDLADGSRIVAAEYPKQTCHYDCSKLEGDRKMFFTSYILQSQNI